jgi:small subunit ribosomal protein S3
VGQKVNPIGLRVTVNKDWRSQWYAGKQLFGEWLHEDMLIRDFIRQHLPSAGIPGVVIERGSNRVIVKLRTARPGIVIGRKGQEIDRLKDALADVTGKEVSLPVEEIKRPELEAQLVAENIALQLEHRISFRRAMKKAVTQAMDFGAEGIKVAVKGRLGGHEMSRPEHTKEGKIPLHTLRADIDYGFAEARTTFGTIGVKVWIYKGERSPVAGERPSGKPEARPRSG